MPRTLPEKLLTMAWSGDKGCYFIRNTYKVATWNLELGGGGRDVQFEETVEICSYPGMGFGPWRRTILVLRLLAGSVGTV